MPSAVLPVDFWNRALGSILEFIIERDSLVSQRCTSPPFRTMMERERLRETSKEASAAAQAKYEMSGKKLAQEANEVYFQASNENPTIPERGRSSSADQNRLTIEQARQYLDIHSEFASNASTVEELHEKVKVLLKDHPDLFEMHLAGWEGVEEEYEKLASYHETLVRKEYNGELNDGTGISLGEVQNTGG